MALLRLDVFAALSSNSFASLAVFQVIRVKQKHNTPKQTRLDVRGAPQYPCTDDCSRTPQFTA